MAKCAKAQEECNVIFCSYTQLDTRLGRDPHTMSMLTLHFCNGCCLSLFSRFCQCIIRTGHKKFDKNGYRGVTLYLVACKWEITESSVLRAGYLVELFLRPISPLGRLVLAF